LTAASAIMLVRRLAKKSVRMNLCEALAGPFRQIHPDTFFFGIGTTGESRSLSASGSAHPLICRGEPMPIVADWSTRWLAQAIREKKRPEFGQEETEETGRLDAVLRFHRYLLFKSGVSA
jgi:hypothetical protein